MSRSVTLSLGQVLLFVVSLLLMGAAGGMLLSAIRWRQRSGMGWASGLELLGLACFVGLGIWKSLDDWALRTGAAKPLESSAPGRL